MGSKKRCFPLSLSVIISSVILVHICVSSTFVPQAACLYILQAGGLWYKKTKKLFVPNPVGVKCEDELMGI